MPVYNGEKYLREAIESILNQSYSDFELLIINDGSSDATEEIILSYKDSRVRYVKNETNLKLIATLNKGIDMASGKYIVRMDADDVSLPQRLEKQFAFMEANPEVVIAGSWYENIGSHTGVIEYPTRHEEIKAGLLYSCPICHPSIIWRIENAREHFDINFLHAEDYELWSRLILNGTFANIGEVLIKYRIHEESVSRANKETQLQNSIRIRIKQFENVGVKLSAYDSELYTAFCCANWNTFNANETIDELKTILESLLNANAKSHYFSDSFYSAYLLDKWFHLNYNCGNTKTFYQLKIAQSLNIKDKIKLVLKPFFKK